MMWCFLVVDAMASGRFAVPPAPAPPVEAVRLRARPTLLNPDAAAIGRVWTLDELYADGRFPKESCTEPVLLRQHIATQTCWTEWQKPPEPLPPPVPWWAFWRD